VRPTFILWGKIAGQSHGLYQIYPQGTRSWPRRKHHSCRCGERANTAASPRWRGHQKLSLGRRRPALPGVAGDHPSLQSAVGPPLFEVALYRRDSLESPMQAQTGARPSRDHQINKGLIESQRQALQQLPRFAWEPKPTPGLAPPAERPPSPRHATYGNRCPAGSPTGASARYDVVQELCAKPTALWPHQRRAGRRLHPCPAAAAPMHFGHLAWRGSMTAVAPGTAALRASSPPVSSQPAIASRAARPQWSHPCRRGGREVDHQPPCPAPASAERLAAQGKGMGRFKRRDEMPSSSLTPLQGIRASWVGFDGGRISARPSS